MKWVALALLLLAGCPSFREPPRWAWAVDLDYRLRVASNRAHDVGEGDGELSLRGLAGAHHVAYAGGVDVRLGATAPIGFVYGVHLSPVGFALRFGKRSYLGVVGGAGLGGVIDRVPFAWELPVEAFAGIDLGGHVRLLAAARATWTPGTAAREDGATTIHFADEAQADLGLAIGARHHDYSWWSDGTYVGVFAREQMGGRLYGVMLAIAMNGASD